MVAISLCCGKPGRCPVFKKEGRKYLISDKGNIVFFTKGQLGALCKELCKICDCGCD